MGITLLPRRAVTADHVVSCKESGLQTVDVFEWAILSSSSDVISSNP